MRRRCFNLVVPALLALPLMACGHTTRDAPAAGGGVAPIAGSSGSSAEGGSTSGGSGSEPTDGGALGTGGAIGAGAGGEETGGSGGAEPSAGPTALPSPGCSEALPQEQLLGDFTTYTVHLSGATLTDTVWPEHDRAYHVWLPAEYDENTPYPVVFWGCECGAGACAATMVPALLEVDPEKIYVGMDVAPNGIGTFSDGCYDTRSGLESPDWEFFGRIGSEVQSRFCVDENQVYAGGYADGADLAITLGCYFAGADPTRKFGPEVSVRGHMAVAGHGIGDLSFLEMCQAPVAGIWIYDEGDMPAWYGEGTLDLVLERNGCTGSATEPWLEITDGECLRYTDCPAEYPVVFCTTQAFGHAPQTMNSQPAFTEFMDLMKAP